MGSCISKCSPRPKKCPFEEEEIEHTQDKIVISQITKTPIPISNKVSPFPPSPTSSSCFSSAPSFTGTTTTCTSVSSCSSSSVLTSKDRSFSNEFLWACVKENPHIIRINSIKDAALSLATSKLHVQKMEPPIKPVIGPRKEKDKKKRGRSNSPAPLPRQKSFRKSEPETIDTLQARTLKSPSPSRRFSGDSGWDISSNTLKANGSKRFYGSKVSPIHSVPPSPIGRFSGESGSGISSNISKASGSKRFYNSKISPIHSISPSPSGRFSGESGWGISSNTLKARGSKRFYGAKVSPINPVRSSPRKENFRAANTSSSSSGRMRSCMRNRETCIHRISSKIDEIAVAVALEQDGDVVMEDFDNPLIALDCFIFL